MFVRKCMYLSETSKRQNMRKRKLEDKRPKTVIIQLVAATKHRTKTGNWIKTRPKNISDQKIRNEESSRSYQTVLEEGYHHNPWVTEQRLRAQQLCCQSKAQGQWVLERTEEGKRKPVLHITSRANTSDYRSFAVTVLVCVSNMLGKNLNILFSAETRMLICSHKLSSPK